MELAVTVSVCWGRLSRRLATTVCLDHSTSPYQHSGGFLTLFAGSLCFAGNIHAALPQFLGSKQLAHARVRPAAATHAAAAATSAPTGQRVLYPQLSPHDSGYLKVSELHTVYYEVYGNPKGIPAVVVHGGPGAGCFPNHARFFDPAHYR